jgi:hypothetical protein
MMLYKCCAWSAPFNRKTMASMFGCGIFVCGANEGYDEFLDGVEKLCVVSIDE